MSGVVGWGVVVVGGGVVVWGLDTNILCKNVSLKPEHPEI